MKKTLSILLTLPFSLFAIDCSSSSAVKEYNGHYYSITSTAAQFTAAKIAAENENGYLAIPNNAAENEFIRSVIGKGNIAWIGIYDPSFITNYCYDGVSCSYSDSRFKTIKNTALTYRNWGASQPDNLVKDNDIIGGKELVTPLGEHWVAMSGNNGQWLDEGNHAESNNNPIVYKAVFEFDTKPQCFFEDDVNATVDLTTKKCNTKIYDDTADIVVAGETKECLKDMYNTDYCPSALAPAATYWSYDDGYSVSNTATVIDYEQGTYSERTGSVRDFVNGTSQPHTNTEINYSSGTSTTRTGTVRDWVAAEVGASTPALEQWSCVAYMDASGSDSSNGKGYTYVLSPGQGSYTGIGEKGRTTPYKTTYWNTNYVTFGANCSASMTYTTALKIGISYIAGPDATATVNPSGAVNFTTKANSGNFAISVSFRNYSTKSLYCADGSTPVNGLCGGGLTCPSTYTLSGSSCYKDISYNYYSYGCPSGYAVQNSGLTSCGKTDPNTSVRNDLSLASSCNSSTPPANNCVRTLNSTSYEYICGAGYIPLNSGLTQCPSGSSGDCNSAISPTSNCYKDISYKYYTYGCSPGYTTANYGLTSCIKTDPDGTRNNEATLDDPCNTATPPAGNCQKPITYTYYEYLCNSQPNTQNQDFEAQNDGMTSCTKTDTNNVTNNSSTLDDPCNSSTPPANNCQRQEFTCNSQVREPAWVDNQWQCSPFPCVGESNVQDLSLSVGTSDKNNEGWDSNGNCNGRLYLFSGKSNKCRSWDAFAGLVGGGCCDKDKVFLGLVSCKASEKQLASSNKSGMCHEIGEFCSQEMDLLVGKVCIEKSKSYCCFNSKFARILQEQGRPQLGINWGNPKNPICRGFTPQEFQKLDMSQMNLDEFVNSIVLPDMTQISNTVQNKVQNHLDALSTP